MAETRARDVATTFGQAVEQNSLTATGSLGVTGLSVYATIDDLPLSGIDAGTQALVTSTNTLYINNGVGWFKIALINTNPYFTDSGTPESTYSLSSQGTATIITLIAVDSEGIPIIYSATADSDFGGLASISQDSSVFTITPFSEDSATTSSGTVTFKATDGVNIASALSTFTLQFSVPNSSHTLFLAKASGNAGTNAITDESSNGYTLTKSGDVKRSAFSPYRDAGYSYYFDGSGDYIAMPSNSTDVQFGSGDFTVEAWIYPKASGVGEIINKWQGTTSNSSWRFWISANNVLEFDYRSNDGSTYVNAIAAADNSIRVNEWQHVAATRNGSTWRLFNNGIKIAEATDSGTINNGSYPVWIGRLTDSYSNDTAFTGYITDARIVKGTAIYTADFTVPTERLTAVSGTSLLTCHLPYLADGSSSDYSLTANGNVKAEAFTPFDNNAAYSASNNGSSFYLDGNGDYITVSDTAARLGGSGSDSWTIECWVYLEGLPSTRAKHAPLWTQYIASASNRSLLYINQQENKLLFWVAADGTTQHETALSTNLWYHVAMVKSGNSVTVYLNGKGETDSIVYDAGLYQENPTIGAVTENGDYLHGYIADYVMTKGTAKYSADFTPPTAPISNSSSTVAIANVSTPNLYDASQTRFITLGGNTSSSTGQTKYASSSMYFDGSGDYAYINYDSNITKWWEKPYTIEAWIYPTNLANWGYDGSYRPNLICHGTYNSTTNYWSFGTSDDGAVYFYYYNGSTNDVKSATSLVTANTWSHIAMSHNNGVINLYHNGTLVQTATVSGTPQDNASYAIAIGSVNNVSIAGYVEDLRITTDLSRYSYIPAKETLSADANTILLTAHASSVTDGTSNSSPTASGNAAVTTYAPKQGMYSIDFDGTDDKVTISNPNTAFGSLTGDYTIECWVNMDAVPSGDGNGDENQIIGQHSWPESATSGNWWALFAVASGVYFYTADGSNYTVHQATSMSWTVGKWTHIAVVKSSGTVYIYIDGSLQTSGSNDDTLIADNNRALTIGNDTGNTNDFNGQISNLRISNTARYTNSFTPPTAELQG